MQKNNIYLVALKQQEVLNFSMKCQTMIISKAIKYSGSVID